MATKYVFDEKCLDAYRDVAVHIFIKINSDGWPSIIARNDKGEQKYIGYFNSDGELVLTANACMDGISTEGVDNYITVRDGNGDILTED